MVLPKSGIAQKWYCPKVILPGSPMPVTKNAVLSRSGLCKDIVFTFLTGPFPAYFSLLSSFHYSWQNKGFYKILRWLDSNQCQKRPLYQLCHNHCPCKDIVTQNVREIKPTPRFRLRKRQSGINQARKKAEKKCPEKFLLFSILPKCFALILYRWRH